MSHQISGYKYIVITGGAGFIGSAIIRMLNDSGIKNLIIVDNLGSGEKWKNLVGKQFVDVIHKEDCFNWLKGKENAIESFIHLGACTTTVEMDANYLLENNYRYSVRLADYALSHGHRFIYASSAATYGDGKRGFSDCHETLESYQPLNMYGFSKHLFDLWLKQHHLLDKVVGLKYFNVFGPNEYHKGRMSSAILKMFHDLNQKGRLQLFKSSEPDKYRDGEQMRDFIYVKDAARMTIQFLTNDCTGIFNIGRGEAATWKAIAEGLMQALGKSVEIEYIPMPKDLVDKYQNYTCASMKKSAGLFQSALSLEEALKDYVQNYLLRKKFW
ncbi:MAG: ADP-glyceromanno-heptose 6-epimerase [Chlamydiales bacterium]